MTRPEAREQIGKQGAEAQPTTPAELVALTKDQYQTWAKVIREANISRD